MKLKRNGEAYRVVGCTTRSKYALLTKRVSDGKEYGFTVSDSIRTQMDSQL